MSDFGSLDTAARSQGAWGNSEPTREDDETEDLDSLDDGLHAFNEPSVYNSSRRTMQQSGQTAFPTHDGLGAFAGTSSPVQEQFWQHERYNPKRRRHSLRRSSLQRRFASLAEGTERDLEDQRMQRIEMWRIEQSQAILEEIERETRNMQRQSKVIASGVQRRNAAVLAQNPSATASSPHSETPMPDKESFWQRLTRRVIHDLMGIDDATLSFIFGEALPASTEQSQNAFSAAELIKDDEQALAKDGELTKGIGSWEDRLLHRIARELGTLVHWISEHPGAFSTYLSQHEPLPYAGLKTPKPNFVDSSLPRPVISSIGLTQSNVVTSSVSNPHFAPTLAYQHHHHRKSSVSTTDPSLWGIEEEPGDDSEPITTSHSTEDAARLRREREYWERDLDVKMVFAFLRNRLSSSPPDSSALPTYVPTVATQGQSIRRAALIRRHHPLVSRNFSTSAAQQNGAVRPRSAHLPSSPLSLDFSAAPLSPILGRRRSCASSSCASQSTKKSKTARSGSSRNYWDFEGGSGASAGGWGRGSAAQGWGEV